MAIGVCAGSVCIGAALGKNYILRAVGMVCRSGDDPVTGQTYGGIMTGGTGNIAAQGRRLVNVFCMHAGGKYIA